MQTAYEGVEEEELVRKEERGARYRELEGDYGFGSSSSSGRGSGRGNTSPSSAGGEKKYWIERKKSEKRKSRDHRKQVTQEKLEDLENDDDISSSSRSSSRDSHSDNDAFLNMTDFSDSDFSSDSSALSDIDSPPRSAGDGVTKGGVVFKDGDHKTPNCDLVGGQEEPVVGIAGEAVGAAVKKVTTLAIQTPDLKKVERSKTEERSQRTKKRRKKSRKRRKLAAIQRKKLREKKIDTDLFFSCMGTKESAGDKNRVGKHLNPEEIKMLVGEQGYFILSQSINEHLRRCTCN